MQLMEQGAAAKARERSRACGSASQARSDVASERSGALVPSSK